MVYGVSMGGRFYVVIQTKNYCPPNLISIQMCLQKEHTTLTSSSCQTPPGDYFTYLSLKESLTVTSNDIMSTLKATGE